MVKKISLCLAAMLVFQTCPYGGAEEEPTPAPPEWSAETPAATFASTVVPETVQPSPTIAEIPQQISEVEETPSATPSENPEERPSVNPSENPEETPSATPSENPEETPSVNPNENPEETPSATPSENPEETPSVNPSENPEETPSANPSENPEETPAAEIPEDQQPEDPGEDKATLEPITRDYSDGWKGVVRSDEAGMPIIALRSVDVSPGPSRRKRYAQRFGKRTARGCARCFQ